MFTPRKIQFAKITTLTTVQIDLLLLCFQKTEHRITNHKETFFFKLTESLFRMFRDPGAYQHM